jgi:hypothetical protein
MESLAAKCAHRVRILETRNPKHEIRNKPKIPISKARNKIDRPKHRVCMSASRRVLVSEFWTFEFQILNLFRISSLEFCH